MMHTMSFYATFIITTKNVFFSSNSLLPSPKDLALKLLEPDQNLCINLTWVSSGNLSAYASLNWSPSHNSAYSKKLVHTILCIVGQLISSISSSTAGPGWGGGGGGEAGGDWQQRSQQSRPPSSGHQSQSSAAPGRANTGLCTNQSQRHQAASREQHCVTCVTASASFFNVFNCSPDKMYRQDKVKYKPRDSN